MTNWNPPQLNCFDVGFNHLGYKLAWEKRDSPNGPSYQSYMVSNKPINSAKQHIAVPVYLVNHVDRDQFSLQNPDGSYSAMRLAR